jgi:RecA-family ATPase
MSNDSGFSGSTAWHNSPRARLYLKGIDKKKREEGEEPTTDQRSLEFRKNQYGPPAQDIVLSYQNGLFLPVVGATVDKVQRNLEAEECYLGMLLMLTRQGQDLATAKRAENYAPSVIYNHPKGKFFINQKEVETTQQRLLDANKIRIEEDGPPSKRRKRIVPGPGAM